MLSSTDSQKLLNWQNSSWLYNLMTSMIVGSSRCVGGETRGRGEGGKLNKEVIMNAGELANGPLDELNMFGIWRR